jgi:hypothetical protein
MSTELEVFRFMASNDADDSIIISTRQNYDLKLTSLSNGAVRFNFGDNKWVLEKAKNQAGVLIRSLAHGRYLTAVETIGLSTNRVAIKESIWTFESAGSLILTGTTGSTSGINYNSDCVNQPDKRRLMCAWESW